MPAFAGHTSGRADFPHPVPRFWPFLPDRQPIRRDPDGRITLLPCMSSNIMDYSRERQRERLENSFEFLMAYMPASVALAEPAFPRLCGVFIDHLQHLIISPYTKVLVKPPELAA
jgi:hypothetical protein